MGKTSSDDNLSPAKTRIAALCVVLFVLIGTASAIVGHVVWTSGMEAAIIDVSGDESSAFRMRNDGTLVYRYGAGETNIDLADVIRVSKGAHFRVTGVANASDMSAQKRSTCFDLASRPRLYALIAVSDLYGHENKYVMELTPEEEYLPDGAGNNSEIYDYLQQPYYQN